MELEQIVLVLRSCFTEDQLQSVAEGVDLGADPYRRAAELILEGDATGEGISRRLDEESTPQREKVRQLSLSDLRKSLVVEFLEPGRNLGLTLWALLRDGRVGLSHLASGIYNAFAKTAQPTGEVETPDEVETEEEIDLEDLEDLSELEAIAKSTVDEPEEESGITGEYLDFPEQGPQETSQPASEQTGQTEPGRSPREVMKDFDKVLEAVRDVPEGGQTKPKQEETAADAESLEELSGLLRQELAEQEEAGATQEEISAYTSDVLDNLFGPSEDLFEPGAEAVPPTQETPSRGPRDSDETSQQAAVSRRFVTMAGIDIPIESLHQACCRVFGEPVELVTDPELLSKDKLAVVGKHCGIKILHGPSWTIEASVPRDQESDEPVNVSPESMEQALSKAFDEQIKLIPDLNLLQAGVIPVVGRQTGVLVFRNKATRVGLPHWVKEEPTFPGELPSKRPASDDPIAQELESLQGITKKLQDAVDSMSERLATLEATVWSLEYVTVEEEGGEVAPQPETKLKPRDKQQETQTPAGEAQESAQETAPAGEATDKEPEIDLGESEEIDAEDISLEELDVEGIEQEAGREESDEDIDLDFMDEIEKAAAEAEKEEIKKVFSGETILILGGEQQYGPEYRTTVEQLGGTCEWYQTLAEMSENEIADLVDRSDLILTLSDAITDPGILQATNYAHTNNKRCFAHHSANPTSVRNQLVKLVDEGKV